MSVSVTTRAPRPGRGRRQGLHLHRCGRTSSACKQAGDLLEWAEVHGNLYATPSAPVLRALAHGRGHAVRHRLAGRAPAQGALASADMVSVFILPPDGKAPGAAAQDAGPGQRGGGAVGAWPRPRARSRIGATTTTYRQCRSGGKPRGPAADPGGGAPEARTPDRAWTPSLRRPGSSEPLKANRPARPAFEHIGEPGEIGDAERLAAQRRIDAGGGEQGLRYRRRAVSGSGAASCGAGRKRRR